MTWFVLVIDFMVASSNLLFKELFLVTENHLSFAMQHAGEVYGEKAILATELRELQSRLLSLSEERDRSLKIADEVRTPSNR